MTLPNLTFDQFTISGVEIIASVMRASFLLTFHVRGKSHLYSEEGFHEA